MNFEMPEILDISGTPGMAAPDATENAFMPLSCQVRRCALAALGCAPAAPSATSNLGAARNGTIGYKSLSWPDPWDVRGSGGQWATTPRRRGVAGRARLDRGRAPMDSARR